LIRSAGEKWAPVSVAGKSRREPRRRGNPIDTGGPTIFAALKQQLRLKLAPQKAPVEIRSSIAPKNPRKMNPPDHGDFKFKFPAFSATSVRISKNFPPPACSTANGMSEHITPISEKRLAANRANAQKSTGPRTPEGRAKSSQNAVKHGFRGASFTVVRLEDLDEVENFKADAVHCYRPVNAQELAAVERIAISQQQMLRGARLEAGMFTAALDEVMDRSARPVVPMTPDIVGDGDIEITRAQNRNLGIAEGFRRMVRQSSDVLSLMLRYQAQSERMYRRAIEDFNRLKALRDEMPNEPNELLQPEQTDEVIPLEELNPDLKKWPEEDKPAPAPPPSAPPARIDVEISVSELTKNGPVVISGPLVPISS
jgi:hypothetical protein